MAGTYTYAVIGSGMQGTAEGYDLARFGDAARILMCDRDGEAAERAARKINKLTGQPIAVARKVDVRDRDGMMAILSGVDTCCGAAHYALNRELTGLCISAGCHFNDMGGNTRVVNQQHEMHEEAVRAGVSIVPDCGLAPGLGNILASRTFQRMNPEDIQIRCGGLPQHPKPPLDYAIVFSVAGLTNEYTGMCREIRRGVITEIPAFTEWESIDFDLPVGRCEAFLTSGGTSTGPDSFLGRVDNYGYKTVRYPGHFEKIRAMIDLGFLDLDPIEVKGTSVVPRDVFHVLAERNLKDPGNRDLVVLRVTSRGRDRSGRPVTMVQDLVDFHDETTGFSAMERTTAFSASIVAIMMTKGLIPAGVQALELAVDGDFVVEALAQRNIQVATRMFDS